MKKLLPLIFIAASSICAMAGGPTVNTTFSAQTIFLNAAPGSVTSGNFTISMSTNSTTSISQDMATVSAFVGGSLSSIVGISSGILNIPSGSPTYNTTVTYFIDLTNSSLQSGTVSGYFQLFSSTSAYNYFTPNQVPFSFVVANPVTENDAVPTMADAINIFPNPSSQGYVDINTDKPFTADLYDMNGKLVMSKSGLGSSRISVATKGEYILKVQTAAKQTSQKIIIE